jgi:Uma2 family endonuclease
MGLPAIKRQYSYQDYLAWPEGERWELVDGEAYAMSPAPALEHQGVLGDLFALIAWYLRDKSCRVFPAPFDVRLAKLGTADRDVFDVVQPDITVICDPSKLDRRGCLGAPDWVVEILSPSTAVRDQGLKRGLYEHHGVAEYWLIHPTDRTLFIYRLENGAYGKPSIFDAEATVAPSLFPDLAISLPEVFRHVLPLEA